MLGLFLEAIAMELFVEEATFHERAGSITQALGHVAERLRKEHRLEDLLYGLLAV